MFLCVTEKEMLFFPHFLSKPKQQQKKSHELDKARPHETDQGKIEPHFKPNIMLSK